MEGKPVRFKFTQEILDLAKKLRDRQGSGIGGKTPWSEVAKSIGCPSTGSLKATLSQDKAGKRKGAFEKSQKINEKIENHVIESRGNIRVGDLAKDLGVVVGAVSTRLTKLGFDREVRKEMSQDLPEV